MFRGNVARKLFETIYLRPGDIWLVSDLLLVQQMQLTADGCLQYVVKHGKTLETRTPAPT
jgi:hypothetical protein